MKDYPILFMVAQVYIQIVVMGQTPFYRTSNEPEHHFLNIEQTQTCSSIGDWTRTPYFWLWTIKHRTSNTVWLFWECFCLGPCTTTIIRLCRQAAERNNRWRKRRRFQHQQDSKDHLFSCYSDLGMTDFSAIVWEEDFSQLLLSKTCLSWSDLRKILLNHYQRI